MTDVSSSCLHLHMHSAIIMSQEHSIYCFGIYFCFLELKTCVLSCHMDRLVFLPKSFLAPASHSLFFGFFVFVFIFNGYITSGP